MCVIVIFGVWEGERWRLEEVECCYSMWGRLRGRGGGELLRRTLRLLVGGGHVGGMTRYEDIMLILEEVETLLTLN